ncbi:hypothetical protein SLS54_008781 [Diplodia seriata]
MKTFQNAKYDMKSVVGVLDNYIAAKEDNTFRCWKGDPCGVSSVYLNFDQMPDSETEWQAPKHPQAKGRFQLRDAHNSGNDSMFQLRGMLAMAAADTEVSTLQKLPYQNYDHFPLIVGFDVENYEGSHDKHRRKDNHRKGELTEFGFSILDTADVRNIPPGLNCANWFPLIKSRHFRIRGREHLRNGLFTGDKGDRFRFGTSTWISAAEVRSRGFGQLYLISILENREATKKFARWQ